MAFWNRKKEKPQQSAQPTTPLRPGPANLARVKHIIAIASGKGGVGKSTLTANLAVALASRGAKVALMDADIYGASQPGMFGAESDQPQLRVEDNLLVPLERHGISFVSMGLLMGEDAPVVWRAPMVIKMLQQFIGHVAWGEQDYLLIDLPPGTGDIQLTLAQRASLSGAVIVTTPQQVAVGIAQKGMKMFEQVKVPILGVIENMSGFTCEHCGKTTDIFDRGGGSDMAESANVPFLGAVPLDKTITQSGDDGAPVLINHPDSSAAKAFLGLAESIEEKIGALTDDPKQPTHTQLNDDGSFEITWADGHESVYTAYPLRMSCGCALCVDEDTGVRTLTPDRVPLDIKINGFTMTGRYAITFTFSDGHNTGIYTLDKLRDKYCECDECEAARGGETSSFSV